MTLTAKTINNPQMRVATKSNVKRIENDNLGSYCKNMGTSRIIWRVTKLLAYRHRVGLLLSSTAFLAGYIVWDKFINFFI